ncbi:MAG: spermidine synthase [Pseudomonadota bacterium]
MSLQFEELDYQETPIGAISLRRRYEPIVGQDVYEVKLDDEFLMSSLFTASETALADLVIDKLTDTELDVVVGGLGLGFTASAVLKYRSVRSLLVVDLLPPVIAWHQNNLLPLSNELINDPRSRLREGDFFALAKSSDGFDNHQPGRRFHAILLDIDHSPQALLDERSRTFYEAAGLQNMLNHLLPGGIFALWSNSRPDDTFIKRLSNVFEAACAETVIFDNPYQSGQAVQTVYLARARS